MRGLNLFALSMLGIAACGVSAEGLEPVTGGAGGSSPPSMSPAKPGSGSAHGGEPMPTASTALECGRPGQACCAVVGCVGGCCGVNRVCVAVAEYCGSSGGGGKSAPSACMASGSCGSCGGVGQRCCAGDRSGGGKGDASAYCSAPGTTCAGGVDGTCVACGTVGQRCCPDHACAPPASCADGVCR